MTLQVIRGGIIVESVGMATHTASMHVGSAAKATADGVASLDGSGDVPLAQVPDTLTGKDADTLDGEEAADIVTNARVKAHFPDTLANVLSDHDKAAHDALSINADQVDGEEAADIVTDARVKAHFPDTLANVLSDHDKAAHDALNIDADTLDSKDASNTANNIPVLDASALMGPQQLRKIASANVRNSFDSEESDAWGSYREVKRITLTNGLAGNIRFIFDIKRQTAGYACYAQLRKNGVIIGTEQTAADAVYETKTEDLDEVFAAGDDVSIWAKSNSSAGIFVRNFRVAYDNNIITVASSNT